MCAGTTTLSRQSVFIVSRQRQLETKEKVELSNLKATLILSCVGYGKTVSPGGNYQANRNLPEKGGDFHSLQCRNHLSFGACCLTWINEPTGAIVLINWEREVF